jgi:hypothetical protein
LPNLTIQNGAAAAPFFVTANEARPSPALQLTGIGRTLASPELTL